MSSARPTNLAVISGARGSRLDPSARDGVPAKMGLDATVPSAAPEFRFIRIAVPGEREVDLAAGVDAAAAADWRAAAAAGQRP